MADNFYRNKRSLRENSSLLKDAKQTLKDVKSDPYYTTAIKRQKVKYYQDAIDYLLRERIWIKAQKKAKKTGQREMSFDKKSQKNEWVYYKAMSEVTKAPTYRNKNKNARYQVKVTSKKRIAYFPTVADWDYNRNYKIYNR